MNEVEGRSRVAGYPLICCVSCYEPSFFHSTKIKEMTYFSMRVLYHQRKRSEGKCIEDSILGFELDSESKLSERSECHVLRRSNRTRVVNVVTLCGCWAARVTWSMT